ncbi:MAG: DUF1858 domain-containing protein [Desulfuromonadales bacterium]|nr:DUF1858 domain-containing protein [Desulfuromonadales bacterium]
MSKIDQETKIGELLKAHPEAAKVLLDFDLHCVGCGGAAQESIRLGALSHGLDPEEVVRAINVALK